MMPRLLQTKGEFDSLITGWEQGIPTLRTRWEGRRAHLGSLNAFEAQSLVNACESRHNLSLSHTPVSSRLKSLAYSNAEVDFTLVQ